jgi:ubiquitin-hydrolase Zn-finger-containing protein
MGLLENVRSALQLGRAQQAQPCSHLDQVLDVRPTSTGCQPCLDVGDTWVHLRMCMSCGHVLCCDSSKNKHASRHAGEHAPTHQIARSIEPGEDWLWCYTDQLVVQAPRTGRGR